MTTDEALNLDATHEEFRRMAKEILATEVPEGHRNTKLFIAGVYLARGNEHSDDVWAKMLTAGQRWGLEADEINKVYDSVYKYA